MKRRFFYFFLATILLITGSFNLPAQELTSLKTRQMGDNINLVYSIENERIGQLFNIRPYYSVEGEHDFRPMNTTWGNIGASVPGGLNQIFIWDVLEDAYELQGDVSFKLVAEPHSIETLDEEFSDVIFELVSLHHIDNNRMELVLNITNEGSERDLKIFNRLISITGFNQRKYEAQWGEVGGVVGAQRYSAPQRTLETGESIEAVFRFHRIPDDFGRVMRLEVGVELLTITFGVEVDIGNMQFRDLPVLDMPATEMARAADHSFEKQTLATFNIEPIEVIDTIPPVVTFTSPSSDDVTGEEGLTVSEENLVVKGTATDDSGVSQVVVNGRDASLREDDSFEAKISLQPGHNEVVVRAIDTRFNSVEHKFSVHREAPPGESAFSDIQELDNMLATERPSTNYAFIVGVNEYPDPGIVPLQNPVSDAKKLANVLTEKYMFERENVFIMENVTRAEIIDELDRLTRRVSKDDNLLMFFAGHGFFDMDTELGYWLLKDASLESTANWMANSQIRDYIGAINSRHTLLIADACFSGGIFQTRRAFPEPTEKLDKAYTRPSRKAMTSGNLSEVPDESVFLKHLVKRLEENTRSYILAEELFSSFKPMVVSQTSTEPQYGDIKGAGDEGGDFIFRRRE